MKYKIKWVALVLLIGWIPVFVIYEFYIVIPWMLGWFSLIGPRLENSMDRVYCGQEMARHKLWKWDVAALCWVLLEIGLDIFAINNLDKI